MLKDQVAVPVCHHLLTSLGPFHDKNSQHTVKTLLLSILFPLLMLQHGKAGWVFMIICLNYISDLFW